MTFNIFNKKQNTKKIIVCVAIGIITLAAILFLIIPCINASLADSLMEGYFKLMMDFFEIDMSGEVTKILTGSELFQNGSVLNALVNSMMAVMKTIAASLFMVRVMIEAVHEFQEGQTGLDPFLKLVIKMTIALTLIGNIDNAIVAFQQWLCDGNGKGFLFDIRDAIGLEDMRGTVGSAMTYMVEMGTSSNFWSDFLSVLAFVPMMIEILIVKFLSMIISGVILIIIKIASYTLVIEFTIRRIFMPVALVSLMEDGVRGPGMKYIKRMFGLGIRMAIMIVSFGVADMMLYAAMLQSLPNMENMAFAAFQEFVWSYIKTTTVFTIAASSFSRRGAGLADEIMGI